MMVVKLLVGSCSETLSFEEVEALILCRHFKSIDMYCSISQILDLYSFKSKTVQVLK